MECSIQFDELNRTKRKRRTQRNHKRNGIPIAYSNIAIATVTWTHSLTYDSEWERMLRCVLLPFQKRFFNTHVTCLNDDTVRKRHMRLSIWRKPHRTAKAMSMPSQYEWTSFMAREVYHFRIADIKRMYQKHSEWLFHDRLCWPFCTYITESRCVVVVAQQNVERRSECAKL